MKKKQKLKLKIKKKKLVLLKNRKIIGLLKRQYFIKEMHLLLKKKSV